TGRCLRNAHLERWLGREVELMRHLDDEAAKYVAARSAGNFDVAAVIAGESSGLVRDITSAREVIEHTVREAATLLAQGRQHVEVSSASWSAD
ncbi:MAG: nitronate monooxygenase, partial [Gemmatimonadota bacterium]